MLFFKNLKGNWLYISNNILPFQKSAVCAVTQPVERGEYKISEFIAIFLHI